MKTRLLAALCATALFGVAHAGEVVIYKQPNFTGQALTLKQTSTNLAPQNFHDQASSLEVKSGRWEFCSQPDFKGDCMTLEPGRYATLDQKLNHRIESAREVTRVAEVDRARERVVAVDRDRERSRELRVEEPSRYDRPGDRWADSRSWGRGGVELFAGPGQRGRGVRVYRDVDTFADTGLAGRISSLVIHDGNWQVCSGEGFEGFCRVLEPGVYDDLGRFDNRIGSMRRVG